MSKSNRFLPLILAVALGGAGPADVLAAVQHGDEMQDRALFRQIADRLSVLYLMSGKGEEAVKLQKETMNMAGRSVPVDLVRSRGEELVTLLTEDFNEAEAARFRAKLQAAGIEIGSQSATGMAAPARPAASSTPALRPVAEPEPKQPSLAAPKPEDITGNRRVGRATASVVPASKPVPADGVVMEEETVVVGRNATPGDDAGMAVVKVRRQPGTGSTGARAAVPAPKRVSPASGSVPAPASKAAIARVESPASNGKMIEEETVTVEEETVPSAEPKRTVGKVRRVQAPPAPSPAASVQTVASATAKVVKQTTLAVPRSMIVSVPKATKKLSQPLFPKKVQPGPVVVPEPDRPIKSVSLAPKRDNALRDLSSIMVSIEFRDVQLADLVRLLANKANLNMVSKNPISGQTTVNFQDIPIGTALDTVLKTNGYSYEVRDGVVWVFRVGEEPLETRVFFLRHAMAHEMIPLVENTLQQLDGQLDEAASLLAAPRQAAASTMGASAAASAPAGGAAAAEMPAAGGAGAAASAGGAGASGGTAPAPSAAESPAAGSGSTATAVSTAPRVSSSGRWSIQADERSNSLIVLAPRPKLDEIARLLEVFDVSMENRQMQERIFKLKYIDRNTLVKAIRMVLPRFDPDKQMLQVQRVDSGMGGSGNSGGGAGGGTTGSAGGM